MAVLCSPLLGPLRQLSSLWQYYSRITARQDLAEQRAASVSLSSGQNVNFYPKQCVSMRIFWIVVFGPGTTYGLQKLIRFLFWHKQAMFQISARYDIGKVPIIIADGGPLNDFITSAFERLANIACGSSIKCGFIFLTKIFHFCIHFLILVL